jgi:NAD(P)-dependent dehydrogenase (short-subunit alcohol dehydrogenase family)
MQLGLEGRRAVVTGASKGIGLAITRGLVGEGARVIAGARTSSADLAQLAEDGGVREVLVDLATPGGPEQLVAAAAEEGPIDVLVNNVGAVHVRTNGFLEIGDQDWLDTWNLTFLAAVRATRAVVPHMLVAGRGTIVTVVSVNAFLPDPGVIDYSAAKAALANFSKALSKELGPQGIRVNTVSPGPVSTGLWLGKGGVAEAVAASGAGSASTVAEQQAQAAATGRFTEPDEVADLVLLLAGDRAANVTGADYVIDGGLVTTL